MRSEREREVRGEEKRLAIQGSKLVLQWEQIMKGVRFFDIIMKESCRCYVGLFFYVDFYDDNTSENIRFISFSFWSGRRKLLSFYVEN